MSETSPLVARTLPERAAVDDPGCRDEGIEPESIERFGLSDWPLMSAVAFWPFCFLWPYVLGKISIGNDFDVLYYDYKAYFLASLAEGHFPYWSPTEACGLPFMASPFVQPFYPLNILYFLSYHVFHGLTAWDYSMFTIMGLSIYGAGLFLWMRALALPRTISVVATLIALMSLKLTELLRFPNAMHSAAWMPWILLGITLAADRPRLRLGAVVCGVSAFMLFTAGYPYFIVYSAFLIGPFLGLMLVSPTRRAFLDVTPDRATGPTRLAVCVGGAFLIAAAAALPWLRQVQVLMAQSVDRAVPNFDYAALHSLTVADTVGSWVFPPASMMEGWHYFGMSTALLIGAFLISLTGGTGSFRRHRRIAVILLPWIAVVTYFTWGKYSALFKWVWPRVPVLNQMRVWPRMNIILVPLIALLLALALCHYVRILSTPAAVKKPRVLMMVSLALVGLAAAAAQAYLIHNAMFSEYWTFYFKGGGPETAIYGLPWSSVRRFDERFFLCVTGLSFGVLVTPVVLVRRMDLRALALAMITIMSLIDLFPVSSFQWFVASGQQRQRQMEKGVSRLRDGLDRPRVLTSGTVDPFNGKENVGLLDNWGFIRHARFYSQYFDRNGAPRPAVPADQIAAARRLYGADARAERLFVTTLIGYSTPADFIADVDATAATAKPALRVTSYDGDRLEVSASVNRPSWLSFIDNWDPYWSATVDGLTVPIERLFGSYKTIRLPAGTSTVVFTYRPGWWPRLRN